MEAERRDRKVRFVALALERYPTATYASKANRVGVTVEEFKEMVPDAKALAVKERLRAQKAEPSDKWYKARTPSKRKKESPPIPMRNDGEEQESE